jgi:hypothetical protein
MNPHSWCSSYRDLTLRHSTKPIQERYTSYTLDSNHAVFKMALSMLIAIIAAPGLMGSQEAIRQSQSQEKREEHRARRCNLIAKCVKSSPRSREINDRPVVLKDGKLWIDTGTQDGEPLGHAYAGYYLPYPDTDPEYEGLVTTITDDAPIMNWVYVDKETCEVKYGVRLDAQPNLTGPFGCTRQDRRLTFDGWEGWCVVEEGPGRWALYYDVADDGLRSKVKPGTRVLDVELSRKEKRFAKETTARQHDQTTKRAVDVNVDVPVDQPLGPAALVGRPGVVDQAAKVGGTLQSQERPQVKRESVRAEPFRMPKSIFENPPPALEGSVFERPLTPKTPPPAYTSTEPPIPLVSVVPMKEMVGTYPPQPTVEDIPDAGREIPKRLDHATQPNNPVPPLNARSTPPSQPPPSRSISPTYSDSNSTDQKRTTPKLNRSSGTRALAQAQMFEAMASEKKPKIGLPLRSNTQPSRATSNPDSGSDYSRDSQELNDTTKSDTKSTSPTPAPLALNTKPPLKRAETSTIPRSSARTPFTPRPKTPPRQRALTNPTDPAVFGARPRPSREPTPRSSNVRPSTSRSSSQASSNQSPRPPLYRRGTVTDRTASPKALPLQSSPRDALQPNRTATRTSLASTMTTGRGNKGMATRMGERGRSTSRGGSVGPVLGKRKTTSALFRELDVLVGQESSPEPQGK